MSFNVAPCFYSRTLLFGGFILFKINKIKLVQK